jgi:protein-S-isoprenylcysteine O-methyltransferase Ste14
MHANIIILIAAASVWLLIEGLLMLRDKAGAKGTTKADRLTRLFNTLSTLIALCSPLLSMLTPELRFGRSEILFITLAGGLLLCLGAALRYWSIIILGRYFRTTVEIEEGQKVVKYGPYKYIRHPSYSGIILFCLGYGLVSQNWLSFALCAVLPAAALIYRISVEEKELVKVLGTEYADYMLKTKKLIPGIW